MRVAWLSWVMTDLLVTISVKSDTSEVVEEYDEGEEENERK